MALSLTMDLVFLFIGVMSCLGTRATEASVRGGAVKLSPPKSSAMSGCGTVSGNWRVHRVEG